MEDEKVKLWIAPYLPEDLTRGLVVPLEMEMVEDVSESDLHLDVGDGDPLTYLVYALVAPFPTVTDRVDIEDIRQIWKADNQDVEIPLLMSADDLALFSSWWGPPGGEGVVTMPKDELLSSAWENRPIWGIIPFDDLEPQWKVLEVDGISPIWKDFNPDVYTLSIPVSLHGVDTGPEGAVLAAFESLLPHTFNRTSANLTTVVLTGVTAMTRTTALEMEVKGITYPAIDVGEMMLEADITHISNEVPFWEKCPYPEHPWKWELVFCSNPSYIALLEEVGTDVVELTGDHFADWGPEAMLYSLELYRKHGIPYYGGGATPEEGRKAVTFEDNGNRIAFIGCNGKGNEYYAPGGLGLPGAVDCDFNFIANEITNLISNGYVVIFTFQHMEVYDFVPWDQIINDFRKVASYGAQIVSGSQAHQPHSRETCFLISIVISTILTKL
jgi:poly-gamma-glutamate synthesis protein (capsule biosynthesis protein)